MKQKIAQEKGDDESDAGEYAASEGLDPATWVAFSRTFINH